MRQTHYLLAVIPPKLITKLRPAFSHIRMKAFLLVLSEQIDVPKSRVQHVREREVDDAEHATEWQRWFWLIRRERIKSFTFASCEDEGQCFAREMRG